MFGPIEGHGGWSFPHQGGFQRGTTRVGGVYHRDEKWPPDVTLK